MVYPRERMRDMVKSKALPDKKIARSITPEFTNCAEANDQISVFIAHCAKPFGNDKNAFKAEYVAVRYLKYSCHR